MKIKLSFTSQKGQAVTEFAIFLPIYLLLVIGLIFFAKGYFIKQQTVSASRFAAWHDKSDEVEEQVKNYFFRELDKEKVSMTHQKTAPDLNDQLGGGITGEVLDALMGVFATLSDTEGYTVKYNLEVNPYLDRFLGEQSVIQSSHYVDKNGWSWDEGVHGLFSLFKEIMDSIFD